MADNPGEHVEAVDVSSAVEDQPIIDNSIPDIITTSSGAEVLSAVMAEQAERRKLRPIIVGVRILGLTGTVLVLRAIKRRQPDEHGL